MTAIQPAINRLPLDNVRNPRYSAEIDPGDEQTNELKIQEDHHHGPPDLKEDAIHTLQNGTVPAHVHHRNDTTKDDAAEAYQSPPPSPSKRTGHRSVSPSHRKHEQFKRTSVTTTPEDGDASFQTFDNRLRGMVSSPETLALTAASPIPPILSLEEKMPVPLSASPLEASSKRLRAPIDSPMNPNKQEQDTRRTRNLTINTDLPLPANSRPGKPQRALSTPATSRVVSSPKKADTNHLKLEHLKPRQPVNSTRPMASPMPSSFPLPPLSIPTYLQLELSSQRPSHSYIHRSAQSDFPYESSRVKIERLLNFLLLPLHLEGVLWFGVLACLDSWLYTFTILPLRVLKSIYILGQSWVTNLTKEIQFVASFIYSGSGRMWQRRLSTSVSSRRVSTAEPLAPASGPGPKQQISRSIKHHRRTKSVPSMLLPDDKADMLKGSLIIFTSFLLLQFDASKMYHWVRGQAAIKLYVIYNILEVCDRLFSAIGQDVLECLFSREALERKPDGHSKVLRPLWLFIVALIYTAIHSTALFYQVITLNVAVNSYSNALITLLLSNQFVEIKSTVFKKFEKENLFQVTCADIVERFQLWHMLVIIAARNIVETGGLSQGFSWLGLGSNSLAAPPFVNSTTPLTAATPPKTASSILPLSFTIVPDIVHSISSYVPTVSHVIGPFLIVLGSEMLVDWLKHAYITKFNNTRPVIYDRFLDVLAKDYYTNAFGDQNLTKRLGLPVIPLSCLLIRASVQIYQMFVAAWGPLAPASSSTSLASIHEQYTSSLGPSPTSTVASISWKVDELLGGLPSAVVNSDVSAKFTILLILLLMFFVLLAFKLVLGMLLLSFARARYRSMKERERNPIYHLEGGRRVGGWGVVEVDHDKRRWIYEDDPDGLHDLQEREDKERLKREKDREKGVGVEAFDKVKRYEMVAKRIW
jgi:hypothetical protein